MLFRRRKDKERRPFFDFRKWTDFDRVKDSGHLIIDIAKSLFTVHKAVYPESIDEVKRHYELSDDDIKERLHAFWRLAILMLIITLLTFSYCLFLLFVGGFKGAIIALAITCVAGAFTFRYHFWYVQLKIGKLGCTFSEWLNYLLGKQA